MVPHKIRSSLTAAALATAIVALGAPSAGAETRTIRIAKQFGISYLPLTVMEEKKFLEERGKSLGIDIKTEWVQFVSGTPMNEAIISGNLDFASGGVGPLLTIWGKTRGNIGVKGVAAINAMPLYLNSIDPKVKTIKDFTEKDRIALPAVKVSIQAVTLQMAAEKVFGPGQQNKLDNLTVSLSHPDGMANMMSGRSEITAHFTSAPFMYQELEDSRVHKVLDSYEVLDGPHTFNAVWASSKLYDENRKVIDAFLAALESKAENSKLPLATAEKIIRLPENEWTDVPKKIMAYADFMHRTGALPVEPKNWQGGFFEGIRKRRGGVALSAMP